MVAAADVDAVVPAYEAEIETESANTVVDVDASVSEYEATPFESVIVVNVRPGLRDVEEVVNVTDAFASATP
jgi:hypothetical protein